MPIFIYKARDESGKLIQGSAEAKNPEALAERLKKTGYLVTDLKQSKASMFNIDLLGKFQKVSLREVGVLSMHLSSALMSGLPLLKVIQGIAEQSSNPKIKSALDEVERDLQGGSSFAEAIKKHPKVFNEYFVNMVQTGEATGKLGETLKKLAQHLEKELEFKQKIVSALAYPAVISIVAFGAVAFLMTFVMPKFLDIFKESKVALPLPTMILVSLTHFLKTSWYYLLALAIAAILIFKIFISTDKGRFKFDNFKLNMPVLGKLFRKICISNFMRTFATLYISGVPILTSLKVVEDSVGNTVFAQAVKKIRENVREGLHLTDLLRASKLFPADAMMMISSGEESGRLGEMLEKTSELYDADVDYTLKSVTSLFEPMIILVMGGVVGFIALAIMLPIFKMSQIAGK